MTVEEIEHYILPYWLIVKPNNTTNSMRYTIKHSDSDIISYYVYASRRLGYNIGINLRDYDRFKFLLDIPKIIPLESFSGLREYHAAVVLNHAHHFNRLSDDEIGMILNEQHKLLVYIQQNKDNYYVGYNRRWFLEQLVDVYTSMLCDSDCIHLNDDNLYNIIKNIMYIKTYDFLDMIQHYKSFKMYDCLDVLKRSYGNEDIQRHINKQVLIGNLLNHV